MKLPYTLAALGIALAASSGFLVSSAVGQDEPTRTVTINLATGPQGEPGPAGEQGPAGPPGPAGLACLAGYSPGILVVNHPGGQTSVYTCLKN